MSAAHRPFVALLVSLALAACSQSEPPEETPPAQSAVSRDITAPLDKARAVEDTTMKHKEDLDRELDQAESSH